VIDTDQVNFVANTGKEPVLSCRGLVKCFDEGTETLEVLKGLDMQVKLGERVAVIGASGSGKTTLLQLLGGLDTPTAGSVMVFGQDFAGLNDAQRGQLRNRTLGFVYQFHHLLPEFTALENVAMPLLIRRMPMNQVRAQAVELMTRVGLQDRLTHKPGELSGGERQRAAVARALITEPAVVLADEPTGNLDRKTGQKVLDLMLQMNTESGASLVVVTHDMGIAGQMDRVLELENGLLVQASL
jgi:lipoprotein-releasing system ATP-binding protein